MRQHIRNQPLRVPPKVCHSLIDLHVRHLHSLPIRLVNIVLRANVCKVHDHGRDIRHWVVPVRDAVVPAGLRGDVVRKLDVSHARCTEGVQCHWKAGVAQVRGCEGRDGAAEGVTGRHDLVGRIGGCERSYGLRDTVAGVHPGLPEAAVDGAAVAEGGGDEFEVEVGNPVFDGGTAAEGDDDELVLGVGGYVAGHIGCQFAGKVSMCIVGRQERAEGSIKTL